MSQVLHIKNMVCNRCVFATQNILKQLDLPFEKVYVGEIHLENDLEEEKKIQLNECLEAIGLELIDNRLNQTIEKTKQLVLLKARNEVPEQEHHAAGMMAHFKVIDSEKPHYKLVGPARHHHHHQLH